MRMTMWPRSSATDLAVQVATDQLPGLYDATVRLADVEVFHDGWRPMIDTDTMTTLLADLSRLGDAPTQLRVLGWTIRATDGQFELVEPRMPADPIEQVDDRLVLPRECGFTVVTDLPPLAQLYRSLTLLEAHANGPTNQIVDPDELLAEARTAAQRLGWILGAVLGLALDTDVDTVTAVLINHRPLDGAGEPSTAATPAEVAADGSEFVGQICRELMDAAAEMARAYLPTAIG